MSLLQSHHQDAEPTHQEDAAARPAGVGRARGGGRGNQARLERLGLDSGRPADAETLDNTLGMAEVGRASEAGSDTAGEETESERNLIAGFARQVQAAVAPWAARRTTADLVFDVGELNSLAARFREDYRRRFDLAPNPVVMRRALDRGTTRASLREIGSFNFHLAADYYEWLGLSSGDRIEHHYTLLTGTGISVADVIGGRMVPATLDYSNSLGMHWTQQTTLVLATAQGGAGVTLDRDGVHASSSGLSAQLILAANEPKEAEPTFLYFSPEDTSSAIVEMVALQASATAGVSAPIVDGTRVGVSGGPSYGGSGLLLENGPRRLSFPLSASPGGMSPRVSESTRNPLRPTPDPDRPPERPTRAIQARAGASLTAGLGHTVGTSEPRVDASHLQALEEHDAREDVEDHEVLLVSTIYFRTAEDALGPEDQQSIDHIVGLIYGIEQRYTGAIFDVQITGHASRRWLSAGSEDDALARNEALAARRTQVVQDALNGCLQHVQAAFTKDVVPLSLATEDAEAGPITGRDRLDNDQRQRSVTVEVSWHLSDPTQRVAAWTLGT